MNERLLEAKKNAEKFKEYLQSDSKKEVRKFAEELITHKDNIDFVGILEDALTLYDFIAWKKESVPAETLVRQGEVQPMQTAGQWKEIKKDGKPKENGRYLVMCEEGRCTAYYDYLYGWQGDNCAEESSDAPYYEHVTHWAEILEEPK